MVELKKEDPLITNPLFLKCPSPFMLKVDKQAGLPALPNNLGQLAGTCMPAVRPARTLLSTGF